MEQYRIRDILDAEEWEQLFMQVAVPHMVQSWGYGEAKRCAENWHPVRCLIERISDGVGKPVALCQILEKRVGRMAVVSRINRGPLFLEPEPSLETRENVLRELRKRWRFLVRGIVLIAPALEATQENRHIMRRSGFFPRRGNGWSSALLDLRQDDDVLLGRLSGKWQRNLKTAQRRTTQCGAVVASQSIDWLVQRHEEHQQSKGFRGPSSAIIKHLHGSRPENFLIITAELEGEPLAAVAVVRFGAAAEYYIGWNSDRGRQIYSGTALTWHAVQRMKREGVTWFDLGGYGGTGNAGFNEFKKGMGGSDYALAGEWAAF